MLDIIGSLVLLIAFLPIYGLITIIILLNSGTPVLYVWNVIGKNGVPFKSWKFRTMEPGADEK
ncbi:uncharacterized protein METZ01_LOCUS475189, partial [marine metagenome]